MFALELLKSFTGRLFSFGVAWHNRPPGKHVCPRSKGTSSPDDFLLLVRINAFHVVCAAASLVLGARVIPSFAITDRRHIGESLFDSMHNSICSMPGSMVHVASTGIVAGQSTRAPGLPICPRVDFAKEGALVVHGTSNEGTSIKILRTTVAADMNTRMWMDARMRGCMYAWMRGCMGAYMRRCIDASINVCMYAWMYGCADARIHGCMDM